MTILDKEKEIIDEFEMFDDWMDKYTYLIDMGKSFCSTIDIKKAENLVNGCNSQVWLEARSNGTEIFFKADSDALIPKGIAQMLVRIYSGNTAQEIIDHKPEFIEKIGLGEHLSPNRANGLVAMINKMKLISQAHI